MNSFLTTNISCTNSPFLKFVSPFYWIRRNPTKPPPRHGYSFPFPSRLVQALGDSFRLLNLRRSEHLTTDLTFANGKFWLEKSNKKSSYQRVFFFSVVMNPMGSNRKKNKNTVVTVENLVMFFLRNRLKSNRNESCYAVLEWSLSNLSSCSSNCGHLTKPPTLAFLVEKNTGF